MCVRVCVNNLIILCLLSSQLMKNRAKNIAKRRATASATATAVAVAIAICAAAAHAHTLAHSRHTVTLSHTQTPLERAAIQHSTQKLFWCYFNLKVNRSVICGIKYNSSRERARETAEREREVERVRGGTLGAKIEINKNENQIKEAELRKMPFAQFSHTVHNSLDSPSPQPPSPSSPSLQLQFAISVCVWLAGICGRFSIWP